ncbi:SAM pointed domain-containing Ets transcription factor-like isoform X2 [Paramormyrops kingsleyae]
MASPAWDQGGDTQHLYWPDVPESSVIPEQDDDRLIHDQLHLPGFDMLAGDNGETSLGAAKTPRGELERSSMAEECSLELVQSMVVGEVLKDIKMACKMLNIGPNPAEWTAGNVQKWVLWTEHLYKLPPMGEAFQELDGKDLCALTEADFRQVSLHAGDILYAHLDIWKSASRMQESSSPSDSWSDEADSHAPGQTTHLWQFLLELLLHPHSYGRCIRWLNKETGIFKIEDSAHVARLWGLRKNRPAMNYDKLSRSIRQYYKKGIIRKPVASQSQTSLKIIKMELKVIIMAVLSVHIAEYA